MQSHVFSTSTESLNASIILLGLCGPESLCVCACVRVGFGDRGYGKRFVCSVVTAALIHTHLCRCL